MHDCHSKIYDISHCHTAHGGFLRLHSCGSSLMVKHRRPRQARRDLSPDRTVSTAPDGNRDDPAVGRFHDGRAIQRLQDCQRETIVSLVFVGASL